MSAASWTELGLDMMPSSIAVPLAARLARSAVADCPWLDKRQRDQWYGVIDRTVDSDMLDSAKVDELASLHTYITNLEASGFNPKATGGEQFVTATGEVVEIVTNKVETSAQAAKDAMEAAAARSEKNLKIVAAVVLLGMGMWVVGRVFGR